MDDDFVTLLDDYEEASVNTGEATWRVLIVDDDPEVHQATHFALGDLHILERPLQLDSVYSAQEALEFLQENPDISVILLDVVMESEDAGLQLVGRIRDELALDEPRIILRTGQPGYAPEVEVITRYDINDYRTKSELTHTRLVTSLIAALRGFQQIHQINTSRKGLNLIIEASNELLEYEDFERFSQSVLRHLGTLLGTPHAEGVLLLVEKPASDEQGLSQLPLRVVASSEHYSHMEEQFAERGLDHPELCLLRDAMEQGHSLFTDEFMALYGPGKRHDLCVLLRTGRLVDPEEQYLLRVFGQHLSVSVDNISLIGHLQRIAFYDPLTGLPNRQSLLARIGEDLENPSGRALALIDIDHFNAVNESIGYEASELLLQRFSDFLLEQLGGDADQISRIGPDIFAINSINNRLNLNRIQSLTRVDLDLEDQLHVKLTASGVWVPLDADNFTREGLLSAAYAMLKEAKSLNIGHVLAYRTGLIGEVHENAVLLQEMARALDNNEFRLAYQPKWDLQNQRFHGMETLIRWQRPDGSWVSPGKFIPIAETSGLIVRLGQWILQTACEEYAELLRTSPDPGPVAVNISGGQFRDNQFIGLLQDLMELHSIRPDQLVLEITETAAINDGLDDAVARLQAIRDLGVRIALDDFGTGYSSLSYLQQLPVDQLKIDRSFVLKIKEPEGRAIIDTIVGLSHSLNLEVVAEGAEELAEVRELMALNCDTLQGYVYARPMSMQDLLKWQTSAASKLDF